MEPAVNEMIGAGMNCGATAEDSQTTARDLAIVSSLFENVKIGFVKALASTIRALAAMTASAFEWRPGFDSRTPQNEIASAARSRSCQVAVEETPNVGTKTQLVRLRQRPHHVAL